MRKNAAEVYCRDNASLSCVCCFLCSGERSPACPAPAEQILQHGKHGVDPVQDHERDDAEDCGLHQIRQGNHRNRCDDPDPPEERHAQGWLLLPDAGHGSSFRSGLCIHHMHLSAILLKKCQTLFASAIVMITIAGKMPRKSGTRLNTTCTP